MTVKDLIALRKHITIAHHVPGRIRLKFALEILQSPVIKHLTPLAGEAGTMETLRKAGLVESRLNPLARSLVLEYDPKLVGPDVLNDFLTSDDMQKVTKHTDKFAALFGIQLDKDKENC